ncbi:hypothetical protein [Rhodanobacter fulvus]|uniref:hypothetical protein n=1 Tax=Rhodanobacter fulvus TaxID=219571 RepID=UPI0012EA25D5|nr:hypothetical protein [Rhodanobacter fulvus]
MKIVIFGFVLAAMSFSAVSATPTSASNASSDSAWVEVSSTDTQTYSVRKGSFEITQTKAGAPIAVVLGQSTGVNTKAVVYRKWYVSKDDCVGGLGKLVILSINGDYAGEIDFVSKGESAASNIADTICSVYLEEIKKQQSKGM